MTLPVTKRERNDIIEVCIKHFKYLSEKSSASGLTQEEEDFMKTMQEIDTLYRAEMNRARLEGQLAGRLEGEREGELKGQQELVLRQLTRRVGNVSIELATKVRALPIERLEEFGEALLDFTSMEDAIAWFDL
jgi:predicted transposase YdaD